MAWPAKYWRDKLKKHFCKDHTPQVLSVRRQAFAHKDDDDEMPSPHKTEARSMRLQDGVHETPLGASRYDVHKIFGFFDPLPLLVRFWNWFMYAFPWPLSPLRCGHHNWKPPINAKKYVRSLHARRRLVVPLIAMQKCSFSLSLSIFCAHKDADHDKIPLLRTKYSEI